MGLPQSAPSCTADRSDPWQYGMFIPCCNPSSTSQLAVFDNNGGHYRCIPSDSSTSTSGSSSGTDMTSDTDSMTGGGMTGGGMTGGTNGNNANVTDSIGNGSIGRFLQFSDVHLNSDVASGIGTPGKECSVAFVSDALRLMALKGPYDFVINTGDNSR